MAETVSTTSRRGMLAVLGASAAFAAAPAIAASAPVSQAAWQRAKAVYQARLLAQEAVEKFGTLYDLTQERKLARLALNERSGLRPNSFVSAQTHPHLEKEIRELDRASEAEDAGCDEWLRDYVDPTDRAAITLLLTPSPDLEAVQFKFAMIARHELHTWKTTPRDCAEAIQEDLHRLGLLA